MMENKSLLVVARKFNDIYYSISSPDFIRFGHKILLIITDRLKPEDYPMRELFDEVYCIKNHSGKLSILSTLFRVAFLKRRLSFSVVMLSNISIVSSKLIISDRRCEEVYLIEDGLMNYYNFEQQTNWQKSLLMRMFAISDAVVLSKIKQTYLLEPESAKYYFGKRIKLLINSCLFSEKLNRPIDLSGKKLFIGQPIYHSYTGSGMTVEEYNFLVNKVIDRLGIDYYVPHTMSSERERINCSVFDMASTKATFEILASLYDFQIYSISSSVLYTTKIINPRIKSVMIQVPCVSHFDSDNILYKYVDSIVEIDKI